MAKKKSTTSKSKLGVPTNKKLYDSVKREAKRKFKVWPSAYASGALSKCRKVGAKNWGNSKKAAEGGVVAAIDNPKRPPRRNLKNGGFIAAGCGPAMQEKKRQVTRIF